LTIGLSCGIIAHTESLFLNYKNKYMREDIDVCLMPFLITFWAVVAIVLMTFVVMTVPVILWVLDNLEVLITL
jgi:hypothetical protein